MIFQEDWTVEPSLPPGMDGIWQLLEIAGIFCSSAKAVIGMSIASIPAMRFCQGLPILCPNLEESRRRGEASVLAPPAGSFFKGLSVAGFYLTRDCIDYPDYPRRIGWMKLVSTNTTFFLFSVRAGFRRVVAQCARYNDGCYQNRGSEELAVVHRMLVSWLL